MTTTKQKVCFKILLFITSFLLIIQTLTSISKNVSFAANSDSSYTSYVPIYFEITSNDDLDAAKSDDSIDVAIIHINSDSEIVDLSGNAIAKFEEVKNSISGIFAFYITNETEVDAAIALTNANPYSYIASDKETLVKQVRDGSPLTSGMVDFRTKGGTAVEIRKAVNSFKAKTALVNLNKVDTETINVLRKMLITVVCEVDSDQDFYNALTSGAHGLLTDNITLVNANLEKGGQNILAAAPLMLAHRGLSGDMKEDGSSYFENTVSAAKDAYFNYGADYVEIDMKLTTDNKVMIMHDDDLTRTTTGTGNIESYTSEQLKQFKVDGGYSSATELEDIPSLEDFMKEFQKTDLYFILEIKSSKAEIIKYAKEVIDKYEMSSRVSFIGFSKEQLKRASEIMPEVSISYLQYGKTPTSNTYLNDVLSEILPLNASYDSEYTSIDKKQTAELLKHGVTVLTWTYGNKTVLYQDIREMGFAGYTTDFVCFLDQSAKSISAKQTVIASSEKQAKTFGAVIKTFNGESFEDDCSLIQVGGTAKLNKSNSGTYYITDGESVEVVMAYTDTAVGYTLLSKPLTLSTKSSNSGCAELNFNMVISFISMAAIAILFIKKN